MFAVDANPSPVVLLGLVAGRRALLIVIRVAVVATVGNGGGDPADSPVVRNALGVSTRVHLPAVVVCAVLGAVVVALVGVSLLVKGPAPVLVSPGEGVITAVTPTKLSSAVGPALVNR